ncbi:twin-arginine translocation signal domain-containing protein [Chromobacterium paludis]|uniref:Twin-arginine translocation signal domain-containing protein n=1 Tax=Chromobacterium paludis TaxID=2605945 RepID=A0A5C1DF01_9NEIS|nr:twin-arginine translocation signal domain-containing protein [Chromobacterium paludis]QEL55362.1 twin-arginine translocation signal domain-containing protein [Chromobacterium paludis]
MANRRQFLQAGALGLAALGVAGYLAPPAGDAANDGGKPAWRWLNGQDAQIVAALAPVMLGLSGLPLADVVAGVDRAVAGLPPAARAEVRQLFDLLGNRWARRWLAGVRSPWSQAAPAELAAFLQGWRSSRFLLLRSAYQGLHQLINAAWYGNPASWAAIGYQQPAYVMERLP